MENVTFHVAPGEIVGLLGPNGAGKTTTLRILACFLPASGGTVTIGGRDVFGDSIEVRKRLGYLPENVPLYLEMRTREYLRFRATLKGLGGRRLRTRVDEVIAACGLSDVRHRVIGRLSKGYRQRIGLADALVNDPEVLILDEPTFGMDPAQRRRIRELIRGLAGRRTVLLSSHILSEVEDMCDRVLILSRGRVAAADSPRRLVSLLRGEPQVIAEIRGRPDEILAAARSLPGVTDAACERGDEWHRITCRCARGSDVRSEMAALAAARGWPLRELRADVRDLEDVFIEMTAEGEDRAGTMAEAGGASRGNAA
jgi:ABC-2 type transport system ATP-binding protein